MGFAKPLGCQNWAVALAALLSVSAYVITVGAFWPPALVLSVLAFMGFWRVDVTSPVMAKQGKTAFGIYLLHPFFMLVVYKFCGSGVNRWLAGFLCFLITWLAVLVLRQFRWGKALT
ncbi:MAG: hypothetical protein RIR95_1110 [Pseudomonadota bacterium]